MEKQEAYFLGQFTKTYGISGGLMLRSEEILPYDIEETEYVFVNFDEILVPFFISDIDIRTDNLAIITLKDMGINDIAELIGREVYVQMAPTPEPIEEIPLLGYKVIDTQYKFEAIITGMENIPGNPLFTVNYLKKEILLPLPEEFITSIDNENKIIHINLPEGLLNIIK